jgi:hypothetical protein
MSEKMRRLPILVAILFSLILIAIPAVNASLGCRCTIKVIPSGSSTTGEPIVTETPANLVIFHTGKGPIKKVWLLIVLNEPTYNALNVITINGTSFLTKGDFQLVTAKKIPPSLPVSNGYPGSLCQYNVAAIKDKMGEKGNPIYYAVKYFLPQITKTPTEFTLAVNLNSTANLRALVLALGRYDSTGNSDYETDCISYKPFNACSSFSNSTLIIPEVATLALTSAPLCGTAVFYIVKRGKKPK